MFPCRHLKWSRGTTSCYVCDVMFPLSLILILQKLFPTSECQNLLNAWSRVPVSVQVVAGRWNLTNWRNRPMQYKQVQAGEWEPLIWFWTLPSVIRGANLCIPVSFSQCRRSCYLGSWWKIPRHYVSVGDHPGQAPRQSLHDSYVATSRSWDVSCGSRVLGTTEVGLNLELMSLI